MSDLTLVLLGAGDSTRFGMPPKKQWLWIDERPLWLHLLEKFTDMLQAPAIITSTPQEKPFFEKYCDATVVEGGTTRQESIQRALEYVSTPYVLISDIARPCIQEPIVHELLRHKEYDCVAPAITPADTVVYKNETIDRDQVRLIQTPQLSKVDWLKEALGSGSFTDESSAIRAIGGKVLYIPGDRRQHKLTYKEDLKLLECLTPPKDERLGGLGYDVHPFCEDRPLVLGGVRIPHHKGLAGHSDADVAIHALIDALLGAAGFGDIGELFPDSDQAYKEIDSKVLLTKCGELLRSCGFVIDGADLTIIAQEPKIAPYKSHIQKSLAQILQIPKHRINIKATTTERLGFVGRKEGIAAQAIAYLHYYDWSRA
ncbi:MAG: bifunctional 2-C-methyl-D-erythritol 4-phosphate cytidylyltransferase/2-C-methyl-D-erythritol 2,4-cyclodiphosphate synthase [Epsilonproteobacteria bacterium]|nr:bifunctional 2-C-methyl-D-erythritol 4-phosphate cytidylyltransferase/2-C-methyl-D-erythritol 2,4-cyclodiphosphate synthase [Campylobacterota bacterium]NPA64949.1 bifunctional 2-C-methyl-D-erythritol 4-phosphate cytidylyltransferase/2-C-methyl-D-erythritol 2,4-cyclodiphosphate synthase [Campylobacterota bacterium]